MKKLVFLLSMVLYGAAAICQEHEQQLETLAERDEPVSEDDSHWQQLNHWQMHRLNINHASEEDLESLQLLTALQIHHLVQYRQLLGKLIDIYELQAVPGWDLATIKLVLPYVTVQAGSETLHLRNGEENLLLRVSNKSTEPNQLGNGLAIMSRYIYKYKNRLQYGITADKDAGEQFLKGAQKTGFDFYSFHLFARNLRTIKAVALGDYTVRLGQGLIQWQGLAFKKSSSILSVKRQAQVLQPYNSPGEYNFYRGAAIAVQRRQIAATLFGSLRKFDATLNGDSISSLLASGYHRTKLEISRKNNIQCFTYGGSVQWHSLQGHVGVNVVHHHFSQSWQPSDKPYDRFSAAGPFYHNYSIDYGYTVRNVHLFGEMAVDQHFHQAMVHGMLASLHSSVDLAVFYRTISRSYRSLFANAFTEGTLPVNENGIYIGMVFRPVAGLQLDLYADLFQFPWLTFQNDAPSEGQEYLVQLDYTPNKSVELYSRYRFEHKNDQQKKNWRTQISYKLSRQLQTRSRVEAVVIGRQQQTGFLFFQDVQYKPAFKPFSVNMRLQYIETDGYDSRIYAMEHFVQYSFAAPAFFNKGWRAVVSANYKLRVRKALGFVFNVALAQTMNAPVATASSANDDLGNTSVTAQVVITRE